MFLQTNRQHMYNWLSLITPDPNWVHRCHLQLSPNSNINCKPPTLAQLSKRNAPYVPSHHFTDEKYHMRRPMNVSLTQQLNRTLFQMTSRRTPSWANTDSPTDWLSPVYMSSRQSNQIWVEHTNIGFNKLDTQAPYASLTIFSLEDQLFIEITILHLYVSLTLHFYMKFNCYSRSQLFTSTWSPTLHLYVKSQSTSREPKQLHTGCITKWLRLYGCLRTLPKGLSQP